MHCHAGKSLGTASLLCGDSHSNRPIPFIAGKNLLSFNSNRQNAPREGRQRGPRRALVLVYLRSKLLCAYHAINKADIASLPTYGTSRGRAGYSEAAFQKAFDVTERRINVPLTYIKPIQLYLNQITLAFIASAGSWKKSSRSQLSLNITHGIINTCQKKPPGYLLQLNTIYWYKLDSWQPR